ncbi:MAG TPA: cytochrome c oxidase subunit I [Longimicrobiales bacterium]|nr:cytochrome c oxidase subunit I [Longimicrobiales bacterium]
MADVQTVDTAPAERLERIWETAPGLYGILGTVDHKTIGKRYLVTAFVFLLLGGIEAAVMRAQLARPELRLLSPEVYDQLFSLHGTTMIFWYASPILSGFSNYIWPLLIGARDMAYPRVNALSYWLFLASGIFLYTSPLLGQAPNAGWFAYPPYTLRTYNPGLNMDFYALGLLFLTVSTTVGAVNFVGTVMKMRAPGMSINRMPIFMYGTMTASFAALFALPSLSVSLVFLFLERRFGFPFYDPAGGGHPLLWQHLFWIFGHPWVYIIVLPAMGIVSEVIPTFCGRPLVGYTLVAMATVATGIIGFGVWVHHMFATGLPPLSLSFFSGASTLIVIPSAVAVFAWIATMWTGRPVFRTPMLFAAGFVVLFVLGGVSGVVTAVVPYDWQVTDTYFVVAHLHYVLIGINVFGVMAGFYYWFPKMTGRLLDERLGRWNFWVMFVGFNLGFFPMHIAGLLGMPRRVYTYPGGLGWDGLNLVTTIGSYLFAAGVLLFLVNVALSRRRGAPAGPNPWDGGTLEWATSSPPPPYNFAVVPTVRSGYPLWEDRLARTGGEEATGARSAVTRGPVLDEGRETFDTSPLEGDPVAVLRMPEDSLWPLLLAIALSVVFYGAVFGLWWLAAAGAAGLLVTMLGWLWPRSLDGGPVA